MKAIPMFTINVVSPARLGSPANSKSPSSSTVFSIIMYASPLSIMALMLFYYYDVFKWYDTEARVWRQMKGLKGLPKFASYGCVKLADYGGKMAVLWDKYLPSSGYKKKTIWCAVISLERPNSEEIWGKVEWLDAVLTVPESYEFVEDGKCKTADTTLAYQKLTGNGLKNNGLIFIGYLVIGNQGKIQTSGSCLYSSSIRIDVSCSWDPRYNDIYNGILIRFIKGSKAYLGQREDSVVIDFNYYRADDALTPRLNQDVMDEMEQMAFFKYGAKPNWGKKRK
ncbi:unnamed protein product [Eruca vesicaria subsp. sativa]|uniref:FKB95-like N-terminal Kelch domain-containing protein n=1 Tax=Eruca vesicaria subsp. sativa TaxID=29727 RepID=A0ABC8K724_ERUVS|nr:unnamed protein product [Eruca vesicaria subsp. sativa]